MEQDPNASLEDALNQIRQAPALLKENAVAQVMARNALQEELDIREKEIADLQAKATLAEEKLHNIELANEIREAIKQRELACEPLRAGLQNAKDASQIAKDTLPGKLVSLVSQKAEILSRFTQNVASALSSQGDASKTPEMISAENADTDKTVEQMLAELKLSSSKAEESKSTPSDKSEE